MPFLYRDRVRESSVSSGLGDMELAGAIVGHQSFSDAGFTDDDTAYYTITNDIVWEVGLGTFQSGPNRIERTSVLASSSGGTKIDFPTGAKDVFVTIPAYVIDAISSVSNVYTIVPVSSTPTVGTGQHNLWLVNAAAEEIQLQLPSVAVGVGVISKVKKIDSSTNHVVVIPPPGVTIDGKSEIRLKIQGAIFSFLSDGSTYQIV